VCTVEFEREFGAPFALAAGEKVEDSGALEVILPSDFFVFLICPPMFCFDGWTANGLGKGPKEEEISPPPSVVADQSGVLRQEIFRDWLRVRRASRGIQTGTRKTSRATRRRRQKDLLEPKRLLQ